MTNDAIAPTYTKEEVLKIASELCQKAASHYFDDSSGYAEELAGAFEELLNERLESTIVPNRRIESIYRVGHLRELIFGLPDDMQVLHQTVGQNGGAWNMHSHGAILNSRTLILTHDHPDLKTLPSPAFSSEFDDALPQSTLDDVINKLTEMRKRL